MKGKMAEWSAMGAKHAHEILAAAAIFATGLFAGSLLASPQQSSTTHRHSLDAPLDASLDASETAAVRKIIDRLDRAVK
jgi:glycerol-3-phosphate O-acyltransferase